MTLLTPIHAVRHGRFDEATVVDGAYLNPSRPWEQQKFGCVPPFCQINLVFLPTVFGYLIQFCPRSYTQVRVPWDGPKAEPNAMRVKRVRDHYGHRASGR